MKLETQQGLENTLKIIEKRRFTIKIIILLSKLKCGNSGDVHTGDFVIIQGKNPHAGVASRDVTLQELSIKRLLSV